MGVILIVITMMPLISKSFDLIVIFKKKNLSTLRCHKTQKQYLAASSMN